eukprot:5994015-Ditylum_brightwellii.AAC.1
MQLKLQLHVTGLPNALLCCSKTMPELQLPLIFLMTCLPLLHLVTSPKILFPFNSINHTFYFPRNGTDSIAASQCEQQRDTT